MSVYASGNPPTKKALKEMVANGPVPCYQPGPFGPDVEDGEASAEGPHYPNPHKWYARVQVKGNKIVKVIA